ncbi:YbjN domain-containing protein [Qipengyuania spongiae]|uniref:YbjN domain-containing protein n=1 Tax=Qipengyuania spongiae TaxID=2909673 RepID=A0ABY5T032_9SPHN|nr:YbjN domain-containing protein [Qipengyuania spongiae]UVI38686.1 YbjN domain-containing protein [Qipengyuania spongiae]
MGFKSIAFTALATGFVGLAHPAHGQTVTAGDPDGMVDVLTDAGYDASLETDDYGDPKIVTEAGGWPTSIVFYDCDENTHDGCGSVQFVTGLDRRDPMRPEDALAISQRFRFLAVSLDEEGDPFLHWDVITDEGVSAATFLKAFRRFGETVNDASEVIFAEERGQE